MTLLKEAMIKKSSTSKGFLIDGYPRELDQGKRFEADVAAVECVLYFEVSIVLLCNPDCYYIRLTASFLGQRG